MLQHIFAISALTLSAAAAAGQTFDLVGLPAGTNATAGFGLSDDGTTAVGASYQTGTGFLRAGWSWSRTEGLHTLVGGTLPANTSAYGISNDGRYMVGSYGPPTTARGYRYDRATGEINIIAAPSPYTTAIAVDASGDGGVVVGEVTAPSGPFSARQAYRWTPQGGVDLLGFASPGHFVSSAYAVSRDGSTIVGESMSTTSNAAFVWRESIGMMALPNLPGGGDLFSQARGVNFDGSIVVGNAGLNGQIVGTAWRNGAPEYLGDAPGFISSMAFGTNDDGSIIVGHMDNSVGPFYTAGIWMRGIGWQRLDTYLASIGVTIPPSTHLSRATSISADGRTIAGYSSIPGTVEQGFVVTIPAPASCVTLTAMSLLIATRRRRQTAF